MAPPKTKVVYRAAKKAKAAVRRRAPARAGIEAVGRNVVVGVAGGLAAQLGGSFHPIYGPPAGMAIVGYLGKNDTLQTIAGMSLARAIPLGGVLGAPAANGGYI